MRRILKQLLCFTLALLMLASAVPAAAVTADGGEDMPYPDVSFGACDLVKLEDGTYGVSYAQPGSNTEMYLYGADNISTLMTGCLYNNYDILDYSGFGGGYYYQYNPTTFYIPPTVTTLESDISGSSGKKTLVFMGNAPTFAEDALAVGTVKYPAATSQCPATGWEEIILSSVANGVEFVSYNREHNYYNDVCKYCGTSIDEACDHSFDESADYAPTCTEAGRTIHTCTLCGYVATTVTPATGHSYTNGTCTVCGYQDPSYVCTHTSGWYTEWEEGVSCGGSGYQYKTCCLCGYSTSEFFSAKPHTFENGVCTACNATKIDGFDYEILEDGTCKITGCTWKSLTVVIPEKIYFYPVTVIGTSSFFWQLFDEVIMPSSLKKIQWHAFDGSYVKVVTLTGDAPEIEADAFDDATTVTVRYPAGNPTYTQELIDSVKYTVWEPYCLTHNYVDGVCEYCGEAIPKDTPELSLRYPTVSFEDEILLNLYFEASQLEDVAEIGLLMSATKPEQWNVNTVDQVLPGYSFDEQTGLYCVQSDGIPAKKMGDTVYVGLYAKLSDGSYVYTDSAAYSPRSYAQSLLSTGNDAMKKLMVAMLNYGAAAQTYFSYNTDDLVNSGLTAEQLALVEDYRSDMMAAVKDPTADKQGSFLHTNNITQRYRTVSFEGAFSVNYYCNFATTPVGDVTMYYWTGSDYEAAESLSVENATAAIPMADVGSGQYKGTIADIAAKNLDKGFYVAFGYSDGTTDYLTDLQTYSIGAYCTSTVNKNISASPLAAATAVYGYYAKQMFH